MVRPPASQRATIDDVDRFVSAALHAAGEWRSPRESDGVLDLRHLEGGPGVWGLIYTIDQVLHPFWLEVALAPAVGSARWTLSFDLAGAPAREVRSSYDAADHPSQLAWRLTLAGTVAHDGDALVPVLDA